MLEDWSRAGNSLEPKHIELLMQAWLKVKKYDRALPWAEKWFAAKNPKKDKDYDLMQVLYLSLNMPEKRLDILYQMNELWPGNEELEEVIRSLEQKR